jgi:hypothetical protein
VYNIIHLENNFISNFFRNLGNHFKKYNDYKKNYIMTKKLLLSLSIICAVFSSAYFISCSKPSVEPTPTPVVTCASKNIVVNGTITASGPAGASNGAITATATGSTGFTYSLGTGAFQATGAFTNLAAGTYSITAKDDAGCTSVKSFTVTATPCPTISITAIITQATNATTTNGAINATAIGSTGFTYSIGGGAFQASGNFTGLGVNAYQVTAKDVNGCTTTTGFSVTAASCPTITVTTTTTSSASPTVTNGAINATGAGGLAPYTYSLNGAAFQATGVFSNLLANNYTVIAKDANGCLSASTAVVVSATPCPNITLTNIIIGSDKCTNNTGMITITAGGSSGYTYNFNGGAYQASNIFNALGTGSFTVGVKDANGCTNTAAANVPVSAAGPTFTVVRNLLATKCVMCHGGANPQNGINFADDCTIVSKSARIKARAVDNIPSVMPAVGGPLSTTDKQKITDWIAAGGQYSN